ncbi:MAG: nucleoside triphosphate pyrophosphohydrolase family protein, partial [Cytophagaceae bacterium]|nr:nucleoside triphosphate pyrophosphohydrolase family protein [Cytophagaceae bacterium]
METKEFNPVQRVEEFHRLFDHPVLPAPQIPSRERCELRVRLIQEELDELKEALETGDIVGVADALCDIQYVLSGAVLETGFSEKFTTLFEEVHRSNMSKACSSAEEAENSAEHYRANGVPCYTKEKEGYFL